MKIAHTILKQNLKLVMNDTVGNITIAKPTVIVKMSYGFLNLDMQSVIWRSQ